MVSNLIDIIKRDPHPLPSGVRGIISPGMSLVLASGCGRAPDTGARCCQPALQSDRPACGVYPPQPVASRSEYGAGPGLRSGLIYQPSGEAGSYVYRHRFFPPSIAYARGQAQTEHLSCTYLHQDIRQAEYGLGFDLVMLIYGEFNVFKPQDAASILHKSTRRLHQGQVLSIRAASIRLYSKNWLTASRMVFVKRWVVPG